MICRNCIHSFAGTSKGDVEMRKHGYQSCKAARDAVERARYFKGNTPCIYPARFVKK